MRVALVHDWLNQVGGAEYVLENLVDLFPQSPVYTSIYDPPAMPSHYRQWDIRVTWMNRLPWVKRHHQPFLPLYPLAFESLDLSEYDVVLSNKSGFCHGIIVPPHVLHICYCLTPTRYVWRYGDYARREGLGRLTQMALAPLLSYLRLWDRLAAERVDRFVAISTQVRRRISRYYNRSSEIIYPPVNTARFAANLAANAGYEDYFLIVARLIPYKRIDLAVQACTELGLPLKVGGVGRDLARLERMAGPTVQFLGHVSDADLPELMARCKAFIFPGEDDFGITPVEAMAAGRPVIAFAGGGALDTVVTGQTGALFSAQTVESLARALQQFNPADYDPQAICHHAEQFDVSVFRSKIQNFVIQAYKEHQAWN